MVDNNSIKAEVEVEELTVEDIEAIEELEDYLDWTAFDDDMLATELLKFEMLANDWGER